MTRFEHARVAVTAGDGIVGRFPGLACVARPADHPALPDLLEHCAKAAGANPGRALARRLAGWLSGPDAPADDLEFGTLSLAGDRLALFLLGAVTARVDGAPVASGGSSAAWADHLMPFPDSPILLAPDAVAVPPGLAAGVTDLRDGVVPGGGVAFVPSTAVPGSAAGPGAEESATEESGPPVRGGTPAAPAATQAAVPVAPAAAAVVEQVSTPAAPVPAAPVPAAVPAAPAPAAHRAEPIEPSAPRRSEPLSGMQVDAREPLEAGLPVGARPGGPATPAAPGGSGGSGRSGGSGGPPASPPAPAGGASAASSGGASAASSVPDDGGRSADTPQTRGHLCSRGHLNDPRSHFCVLCGIRMNERTGVLVLGPRPPLGLLVLDNGATFTVDAEYLLGRTPETDQRVSSGELRPLTIEDGEGAVSRVHAEVRVRGWDVILVDSGSRNGTFVVPPGEQAWTPVASGKSHRLAPGTRVRLGENRTFLFESPSGVR